MALCDSTLGQKSQTMWALVISNSQIIPNLELLQCSRDFNIFQLWVYIIYIVYEIKNDHHPIQNDRDLPEGQKTSCLLRAQGLNLVGSGRVLVASLRMSQGNPMLQTQWSQCTMFSKKTRWFSPCPLHVHFHVDIRWVCWRMSLWAFELCEPQGFCGFPCISVCSTDSAVREPWLIVEMKLAISGNLLNFMSFCAIWTYLNWFDFISNYSFLTSGTSGFDFSTVQIHVACGVEHSHSDLRLGPVPSSGPESRPGHSPILVAKQTVDLAKACESHEFRTFQNSICKLYCKSYHSYITNHAQSHRMSRIMSHIQCQYMSIWYHIITKASLLDGVGFSNVCLGGRTSNGSLFQFNSKGRTTAPHILPIHISPCPNSFRPLPFGLKHHIINGRFRLSCHVLSLPTSRQLNQPRNGYSVPSTLP